MDDLSIEVSLTCPTCGCTEFESEQPGEDEDYTDNWLFTVRTVAGPSLARNS